MQLFATKGFNYCPALVNTNTFVFQGCRLVSGCRDCLKQYRIFLTLTIIFHAIMAHTLFLCLMLHPSPDFEHFTFTHKYSWSSSTLCDKFTAYLLNRNAVNSLCCHIIYVSHMSGLTETSKKLFESTLQAKRYWNFLLSDSLSSQF